LKNQQWSFIDKAAWGDGPWTSEPDKEQWTDEATGLPCLIVRHPRSGHLCGYVGVPEGHMFFEQGYEDDRIDAHGGITFGGFCTEGERAETGVCHIVEPGENDRVWWLGFDCAHCGDLSPAYQDRRFSSLEYDTYKDVPYVKAECARVAAQLVGMKEEQST
jgi:hypothetical protein